LRIFSEEEYFEILLERASAIYNGIYCERERCARLCEAHAGAKGLTSTETPREALLNVAAMIRDVGG
jgi:hypothetical protein